MDDLDIEFVIFVFLALFAVNGDTGFEFEKDVFTDAVVRLYVLE
jgi:hypothetical protein